MEIYPDLYIRKCLLDNSYRTVFHLFLFHRDFRISISQRYTTVNFMIFRNAQRSNKCTYLRIVTRRPELIYPTRTDPQRMSRKKHIFDSTGTIHTRPPLSRLIGNDNQSRSMIIATIRLALPAFLQTGFVALGKKLP